MQIEENQFGGDEAIGGRKKELSDRWEQFLNNILEDLDWEDIFRSTNEKIKTNDDKVKKDANEQPHED